MPAPPKLVSRIGVVGAGVVGTAVARGFSEHVEEEVRVFDVDPQKRTHTLPETLNAPFVFVCLPTPEGPGGRCSTQILDGFFSDYLKDPPASPLFVLKSTTPVGYTDRAARRFFEAGLAPLVVHSPEFLTARCSLVDFQTPSRNIVGAPQLPELRQITKTDRLDGAEMLPKTLAARKSLCELYQKRFPGTPLLTMSSRDSELAKLGANGFFALKVLYFNLLQRIAVAQGADPDAVQDGVLSDGRIAHAHTQVPGPDGAFGFGGACLPKDLANLANCAEEGGEKALAKLLREVQLVNNDLRERL